MLQVKIFGMGKLARLKRCVYKGTYSPEETYTVNIDGVNYGGCRMVYKIFANEPHPRRALIILDGTKTPVRIKGKR